MSTFEGFHQEIVDWIKSRQDKTYCDAALNLARSAPGIRALRTIWEEPAKYLGKQEPIITTHETIRHGEKVDLHIVKVPTLFERFAEIYSGKSNGISPNQWQPYILIAEAIESFVALHEIRDGKANKGPKTTEITDALPILTDRQKRISITCKHGMNSRKNRKDINKVIAYLEDLKKQQAILPMQRISRGNVELYYESWEHPIKEIKKLQRSKEAPTGTLDSFFECLRKEALKPGA